MSCLIKKPRRKQAWKQSEVCWAIQCDGGTGLINGTNASNRADAISLFMAIAGTDRPWSFYRAPKGCHRAVRLQTKVVNAKQGAK